MAAVLPNTTERPGLLMMHFLGKLSERPLLTNGGGSGERQKSSPCKRRLIESFHGVNILVFAADV